jgi:MFS family permease
MLMDTKQLRRPETPPRRTPHAVRAGVAYVRRRRDLLVPLTMMALVGTLAYNFQVTIPLVAHQTFGLGATGFGLLYAAMGAGSVVAGLTVAGRVAPTIATIAVASTVFGVGLCAAALSPSAPIAGVWLAVVGAASVVFSSTTNATMQLRAEPAMRGRVVALYIVAFMGSTPIGGPLVGALGQAAGARAALAVGGAGCFIAAILGAVWGGRAPARQVAQSLQAPQNEQRAVDVPGQHAEGQGMERAAR